MDFVTCPFVADDGIIIVKSKGFYNMNTLIIVIQQTTYILAVQVWKLVFGKISLRLFWFKFTKTILEFVRSLHKSFYFFVWLIVM